MKQVNMAKIMSDDGKIALLCDADVSVGALHDFLLFLKGNIVERMNKLQKDEEKAAEEVKKADEEKVEELNEEKK